MRTRFLLSLCLAAMPFCLVGCDSGGETQVGTGTNEPPPEVKERLKQQDEMYKKMQQQAQENPTPAPEGQTPPPAGGN